MAERPPLRDGVWGFFDVGSNSVLCLTVRVDAGAATLLYDSSIVSGLGKGLSTAGLHPDSRRRTYDAIKTHLDAVSNLGLEPRYHAVATSAMRDACDGAAFVAQLRDELRLDVEIISGEREAELTWLAIHQSFPEHDPAVVFDIGGGSTEIIVGAGAAISRRQSLNLGSVRQTGACVHHDPPTPDELDEISQQAQEALKGFGGFAAGGMGIGSGSTVTTLLAWRDAVSPYDPARIHGALLTAEEVDVACRRLAAMDTLTRGKQPGIAPARAEVIVAGALILKACMQAAALSAVTVSDRGLRFGLMAEVLPGVRLG